MRRADRLFEIVQRFRGGRRVTAAALADELEVSRRTIYRDIADLQATGVPIEGEAGFGYVMAEGFTLPPLMFTEAEIVALVAGARLVRAWGGAAMAKGAEEALIKIADVLPPAAQAKAAAVQVHAISADMTEAVAQRLDAIEAAVEAQLRLSFRYEDASGQGTARLVRPLGLWFWGRAWTLVAWCELRDDYRVFRVDRIADMATGAAFRPDPKRGLAEFLRQREEESARNGQGRFRPPLPR